MKDFFKYRFALFIFPALLLFVGFGFHKVLFSDFYGIHEWRQSDCLSLAYNHFEGYSLFDPAIHNLISDGDESGMSAGEFPIMYWLVGKLWTVFGYSQPLYRMFVFCITIIGFVLQYKVVRHLFQNKTVAIATTVICFSSPILLYYGTSFLTNSPSLSFVQMAWFFLYFGYKEDKKYYLHLGVFFFILAGLLKVTALASFILLFPLLIWYFFKKHKIVLVTVISGLLFLVWWYAVYVSKYNDMHGGKYTFNGFWPIWELSQEKIDGAVKYFKEILFFQIVNPILLVISTVGFVLVFFIKGTLGHFFKYITTGLLLGFTIYTLCWFGAVEYHDYYFVNFHLLIFFGLLAVLLFVQQRFPSFFNSRKMFVVLAVLGVFSAVYGANNLRMRYGDQLTSWKGFALTFSGSQEVGYWDWMSSHSKAKQTRGIDVYLDNLSISRNDKIMCLSDPSFCIELFSAKRKGYTQMNFAGDSTRLANLLKKDVKAIIITNNADTLTYKSHLGDKLGDFQGVSIYSPSANTNN